MKKKCSKCNNILPLKYFNWKYIGKKRSVHCKECSRTYIREHYKHNRKYYLLKAKKRSLRIRNKSNEYIRSYLGLHPCVDCNEKDILVLEFDHKDKTRKDGDVSRIIRDTGSLEKLKQEISKCDVRCANCHRRKTAKESGSWKLKYAPVA